MESLKFEDLPNDILGELFRVMKDNKTFRCLSCVNQTLSLISKNFITNCKIIHKRKHYPAAEEHITEHRLQNGMLHGLQTKFLYVQSCFLDKSDLEIRYTEKYYTLGKRTEQFCEILIQKTTSLLESLKKYDYDIFTEPEKQKISSLEDAILSLKRLNETTPPPSCYIGEMTIDGVLKGDFIHYDQKEGPSLTLTNRRGKEKFYRCNSITNETIYSMSTNFYQIANPLLLPAVRDMLQRFTDTVKAYEKECLEYMNRI